VTIPSTNDCLYCNFSTFVTYTHLIIKVPSCSLATITWAESYAPLPKFVLYRFFCVGNCEEINIFIRMSSHDLVRVFKGVGLVVDHLVVMNKSGLREKISRAQFHVSELMKVGFEIRSDMSSSTESESNQSSHVGSPASNKSAHNTSPSTYNSVQPISATDTSLASIVIPIAKEAASSTSASSMPFTTPVAPIIPASTMIPLAPVMPTAVALPVVPIVTESVVSIPISIQDLKSFSGHHDEIPSKKNEDPTDLIGFDPVIKESNSNKTNQGGTRSSDTVVNGVRTSSMRERAVPATQLVRSFCARN
jgi:hypothetical protein